MTRRVPVDNETEFALWKVARAPVVNTVRRVLVGHRDKAIGESLTLLLSINGYDAIHAADMPKMKSFLKSWKPHAILFDTRLDSVTGYLFARTLRGDNSTANILLLAMSNIWPNDSVALLKEAGFDGHCRRPCSLWRVVDILEGYFAKV